MNQFLLLFHDTKEIRIKHGHERIDVIKWADDNYYAFRIYNTNFGTLLYLEAMNGTMPQVIPACREFGLNLETYNRLGHQWFVAKREEMDILRLAASYT